MNTRLVFKSKREHFNFLCHIDGDYVSTGIDTLRNTPFDKNEVLAMNKSIQFNADEPEAIFWKDHTIILPDYDEKKIIEKIRSSNNTGNLRKIIDEKISKFPKDRIARIDSILSFYHQRGNFNGNALVKIGDFIFRKGYGFADRERNLKFEDHSAFRIGSLSKSFSAMLILQLQQSGKLTLQDSVGKFIKGYRHGGITIQQLLTHTSGIPNFTTGDSYITNALSEPMNPEEMVMRFGSDTLDFQPGTEFRYSNLGYTALAAIIEKVSGQTYRQAVSSFIFNPLKMTGSGFALDSLNTKGYLFGQAEPAYPIVNMAGGGGISSTLDDLVKWDQALNDTVLLNKTLLAELFKRRVEYRDWGADYGYGWMIDRHLFNGSRRHPIIYHPGTDLGYYSMFARQPDKQILIILLNNSGDFERFDITELILNEIN
jgi:CubicO group peptidase (beta-lactamase class C family)